MSVETSFDTVGAKTEKQKAVHNSVNLQDCDTPRDQTNEFLNPAQANNVGDETGEIIFNLQSDKNEEYQELLSLDVLLGCFKVPEDIADKSEETSPPEQITDPEKAEFNRQVLALDLKDIEKNGLFGDETVEALSRKLQEEIQFV